MTQIEAFPFERRKSHRCRINTQTKRFIKYWPLLAAWAYLTVGLWPAPVFGDTTDIFYRYTSLTIGAIGVLSTMFWKYPLLRNIMASIALARSASVIVLAIFAQPPIPFPAIMRLTAAGVLGVLFFALAMTELPYLKVMRNEIK